MAKKKRQTTREKKDAGTPPEHNLPAVLGTPYGEQSNEQLSEQEVFVVDESIESALGEPAESFQSQIIDQSVGPASDEQRRKASCGLSVSTKHKRLLNIQKILIGCIIPIVVLLLYVTLKSLSTSAEKPPIPQEMLQQANQTTQVPTAQELSSPEYQRNTGLFQDSAPQQSEIQKSGASHPQTEGLSLKVASNFYLQGDFSRAYTAYNQLRRELPFDYKEDPLRDFLQLKMAFCKKNAGDFAQADSLFRLVSKSRYPVVKAIANYHLSLFDMQKGQYLNARIRAYQTIALVSALTFDWQWSLSLQRNCQFLVCESLTRYVLSLCDSDKDCPKELWINTSDMDPFINLSEAELRRLLNSGIEQLRGALLSPQIKQFSTVLGTLPQGTPSGADGGRLTAEQQAGLVEDKVDTVQSLALARWSVICNGASIEELLARFAANADIDIHWIYKSGSPEVNRGESGEMFRKRPVSLYMSAATTRKFVTVATGCVGLLAQLDDRGTVKICNPFDYSSLSEHITLLSQEAVSLWQAFLLTSDDDERTGNAHFALGLLQTQRGHLTDAIAEYKLVANRYPRTRLAPHALLASSKLKSNLHDYFGAREDLKQLIEQYPDVEFSSEACLYLADFTMKAGLTSEASRLYRKVYNLGFSLQSQKASAIGAGRCFYDEKDYENAAKWLTRYINLSKDQTDEDFYSACFLLGKTYLAQDLPQQACNAFESALGGLKGQHVMQEYIETLSALIKAHIQQGNFVEAIKLLENTRSQQLSQKESIKILLLKANVLRSMGLVDEAFAVLGDKEEYLPDPELKAKISFEKAKCCITKGDLEPARKKLSDILIYLEPGPLAYEVGCELADVCLKLGADSQAISICLQLLDFSLEEPVKRRVLNLLATAYTWQKNYDQAVLALLGRWKQTENAKIKGGSVNSALRRNNLQHSQPLRQNGLGALETAKASLN